MEGVATRLDDEWMYPAQLTLDWCGLADQCGIGATQDLLLATRLLLCYRRLLAAAQRVLSVCAWQ